MPYQQSFFSQFARVLSVNMHGHLPNNGQYRDIRTLHPRHAVPNSYCMDSFQTMTNIEKAELYIPDMSSARIGSNLYHYTRENLQVRESPGILIT